jgi:hypothetical protein
MILVKKTNQYFVWSTKYLPIHSQRWTKGDRGRMIYASSAQRGLIWMMVV